MSLSGIEQRASEFFGAISQDRVGRVDTHEVVDLRVCRLHCQVRKRRMGLSNIDNTPEGINCHVKPGTASRPTPCEHVAGFGQNVSNRVRRMPASYQLGETADGGIQRHRNQKHGEGRGESLGVHPCGEPTADETANNRSEGENTDQQPVQVDPMAHPR